MLTLARRPFSAAIRRYSSYHPKVRAIPFAFSAEDAISHIGVAASVAGYVGRSREGQHNPSLTTLIASILAKYIPTSGFKPLQPTRIQPLYFPTWFADAELEATAWLSPESDTEEPQDCSITRFCKSDFTSYQSQTATVQFANLYLPGFNMDFGRILVRGPPTVHRTLAKPFSSDLACQWGLDVMCLPYNILPFDILDSTRTLSYSDAIIRENMRFNPQSVKMNLAAAYPVLLPVYLAQYVLPEPWPPVTIIIAAHSNPGVHYIHIPHADAEDSVRLPFEDLVSDQDGYIEVGIAPEDAETRITLINPILGHHFVSDELSAWLNDKLQQRNAPVSMATRHLIDMEDPRIREWTPEEVYPVRQWLTVSRAQSFFKVVLKNASLDESWITNPGTREDMKSLFDMFESILKTGNIPVAATSFDPEQVQNWQEIREALTPEWWRKWEESQRPRRSTR